MSIRVLIVEDSPLMRNFLQESIGAAEGFEVVATARNAAEAMEKIEAEAPDVITLDVELPDMNGIALLERLMQGKAPSVVMVSGLTQCGAQTTLRALQIGAVDFIGKPEGGLMGAGAVWVGELVAKLRRAAAVRPIRFRHRASSGTSQELERVSLRTANRYAEEVIVVGAGSGATDTMNRLVAQLPRDCPPVVVALQLSPSLIQALVPMLARRATAEVKIAGDNERLRVGQVYLGPGDRHVVVVQPDGCVRLPSGEPIRGFRPNIDLLFESAAQHFGAQATGILLDAAGTDGEQGLRNLLLVRARALRQARNVRRSLLRGSEPESGRERSRDIPELSTERIIDTLFGPAQLK